MEFPATDLVVKLVETEDERAAAYAIRIRVFVEEQGVPIEEELDHDDELASHAIAYWGGTPVGTGRMVYGWPHDASSQKVARIGRMAVEGPHRHRGIGGWILRSLEDEARRQGINLAVLHAQTYVKGFYASHGYVEDGDPFLEVGIEHVQMKKPLD